MLGFLKSFSSNIHYKYSVSSRPSFESGCWTVYDAKHKTTNDPVSVFVFSKKAVAEALTSSGIRGRSAVVAEIWEFAARGVAQLTKIRHPAVLKLVEPLETTKSSMTFVTERVVGSVDTIHESDLDELSVVRGMTTVVQALQFLHSQLGMVHANICPQTVLADLQGDWKIAGFEFIVNFEEYSPGSYHLPLLDPRMPSYMHPPYDYLAPELVLRKTIMPANDVWSLACLLYAIYFRRKPLQTRNNPSAYKEEFDQFMRKLKTSATKFPASLQPYLASLFCEDPQGRMTLDVLETTDFFQNPLIKALKAMDEFAAKPVEEKVSFLKHFETLLPQFPKQMRLRKIVKFAVKELQGPRDPATATLLANVLFTVSTDMSKLGFQESILPLFGQLTDYFPFQESVSQNLEVIAANTNDKDFSKTVVPVLVDTLKHHDAQHAALQTAILSKAETYMANLTISKLEQTLFPTIIDCFAATPTKAVKIAATLGLSVLVNRGVSKALITDRLIPALQAMKTRDPSVVLAVSKLWREMASKINSQQVFTLALPHLMDLSLAKQLTVPQFKEIMTIIRDQINAVEKEQLKVLASNQPHDEDDWLNEPPVVTKSSGCITNGNSSGATMSNSDFAATHSTPTVSTRSTSPAVASNFAANSSSTYPPIRAPSLTPSTKNMPRTATAGQPQTTSMATLQPASKSLPQLPPPNFQPSTSSQSAAQPKMMVPLIPSSASALPASSASASGTNTPGNLMGFAPLQPGKLAKKINANNDDDYGSFMSPPSSNTTAAKTSQFDSLI